MPNVNNPKTEIHRSASAPTTGNVKEGHLWYDTTNDVLYVRRNSEWKEMTTNAAMSGDIDRSLTLDGGTF